MKTTFIYALNDPETGECRYIGKADDPHARLYNHLREGHYTKKSCHRTNWIKSRLARGLKPLLEILQEVPKIEWELWERVWIKASNKIGMDLTNSTAGGDCGPDMTGKKHNLETLVKISVAHTGKKRSAAHCASISAARTGMKFSPEYCANISAGKTGLKLVGATSKFRGVSRYRDNCWRVFIRVSGKNVFIGCFSEEIEAAKAYDTVAKIHHGELAKLNFPDMPGPFSTPKKRFFLTKP